MSGRSRALLLWLLCTGTALARVGGGQDFGGGSGGGGGGVGGRGGDGDGGLLLYLLFRLVFEVPVVGIPLLVIVGVVVWRLHATGRLETMVVEGVAGQAPRVHGPSRPSPARGPSRARRRAAWEALQEEDPGLSEPVVIDRMQRVVRRVHEGIGQDDPALASAVSPEVWSTLRPLEDGVQGVREVILAAMSLTEVARVGRHDMLTVDVVLARRETRTGDREVRARIEERWTFRRRIGTPSRDPDAVRRLGCPSCGAAEPTDVQGRCLSCGTPVGDGELAWQASGVQRTVRRTYEPPAVHRTSGGEEPGVRLPIAMDPAFPAQLRGFQGRHPDLDLEAVEQRLRDVFLALQAAWTAGRWDQARPFCTDAAWSTLRFWLVGYAEAGLRNRVEDVEIVHTQAVRITLDAWYEAITVRFTARARDWVEQTADGTVVGGNDRQPRTFAEYWTFVRAVDATGAPGDTRSCPSCGAPLDRVDFDGLCGYCDSVITTGRYDWVLSRITQPEVYQP